MIRVSGLKRLFGSLPVLAALSFSLVGCGGGNAASGTPSPVSPSLGLSVIPVSPAVYDGSTVSLIVTATETNTTTVPTVTLGQLPQGLTSPTAFPLSIPSGGATITLVASSTLAAGSYSIDLNGQAASAEASLKVPLTVHSGTPARFYFITPVNSVAVPAGGSGQTQAMTAADSNTPVGYTAMLSIAGLPRGTTAAISPEIITPGQTVTVTITASSSAPTTQNALVTLIATPSAPVPVQQVNFVVDVTPPPGSLPDNRTDYVSTEGTPYAAVYDPVHQLVFSSNPSWNRVDVISGTTHQVVGSVPVRGPQGLDITQDSSQVWVATNTQRMFSINTSTLAATSVTLTPFTPPSGDPDSSWSGQQVLALADGTLFLFFNPDGGEPTAGIWSPGASSITTIAPPTGGEFEALWGLIERSGDGKYVYSLSDDSGGESFSYDVLAKKVSSPKKLGGYAAAGAVNGDGTRIALYDGSGLNMYDGNFNLIGALPGGGELGFGSLDGGLLFSPDNKTLYEEATPGFTPLIYTIDAASLQVRGTAPAMALVPVFTEAPFDVPQPFAVDPSGLLLGIEDWGIAFDDGTFFENLPIGLVASGTTLQSFTPFSGPLNGGTTSTEYGDSFSITPDVWYGATRGTTQLNGGQVVITSPPASKSGPVNLKLLFPSGTEGFDPLYFTYGVVPQYSTLSASGPNGGVPGQAAGFGLPYTSSGGSVSVAGNAAAINAPVNQYPPFTGSPFPDTYLTYTIPTGAPGYADLTITTPSGTGTLPRAVFYAQSVEDYPSPDTFNAVLYDAKRQQLYLSANDHIDVFSLASNQYLAPIVPPALGAQKQFAGMALTPDGSLLLVTDLLDGSLAIVSRDNSSSAYVIPIGPVDTSNPQCPIGPLYVAPTFSASQAFVVTGALPSAICGPGGVVFPVNIAARSVGPTPNGCGGGYLKSSQDGSHVLFGPDPRGYGSFCIFDATHQKYVTKFLTNASLVSTMAGDGSVSAAMWTLLDSTATAIGSIALPPVYYPMIQTSAPTLTNLLQAPQINKSGSLYYLAGINVVDIEDVQHGLLRMRFSLGETIQNDAAPMAIDSGGRHIYLITNKGLTIVDLGAAILSIGHISSANPSPGSQETLYGSGFTSGTTATVGGKAASATFIDENTLTLTVPMLASGPQDIELSNTDGTTYLLQNAIDVP